MKCRAAMAAPPDAELLAACWPPADLLDAPADLLDSLLAAQPLDTDLAELKPPALPPFQGYTGHLSINGISGHHYHAIAQRLPEDSDDFTTQSGYGADQNVVSSSTCVADATDVDARDDAFSAADLGEPFASPPRSKSTPEPPKPDAVYDISSIEDIAAIIGSAIADTTSQAQRADDDHNSRDSWMDLDAWIEGACGQHADSKMSVHDALAEFSLPHSPHSPPRSHIEYSCKSSPDYCKQEYSHKSANASSTLQTLLTHGYMPLLQNRLQNGPPIKRELPSSTSYGVDSITTSSPPGNAVSTTDSLLLNGRYLQHHYAMGLKPDGLCSPEHLLGSNYPHTTTITPVAKKRSRSHKKQHHQHQHQQISQVSSAPFASAAELSGLLGKEKPVHRCNICNRGFLNKSNIKVHLRTHTGEKPFRCEVCAKAFRQKAHLIKHQQIHKRIGRD